MKVVFQSPVVLRLSSPLDLRVALLTTRTIRATLLSAWYYLFMAHGASSTVLFSFIRPAWWFVAHLGYPVALVGLLLPCDEAPINLWFVQPCADGMSNHHWPSMWQHLRLSIPVYLLLFYLLSSLWSSAKAWFAQTRSRAAIG